MSDSQYADQVQDLMRRGNAQFLKTVKLSEKKLLRRYKKAARQVGNLILGLGEDATTLGQLGMIEAQLTAQMERLSAATTKTLSVHFDRTSGKGIRDTVASLRVSTDGLVAGLTGAEFGRIHTQAVQAMLTTIDGIDLSSKIWRVHDATLQQMRNYMLSGMLEGRSASQVYYQMKAFLVLPDVDMRTKVWRAYFRENPPGRGVYKSAWKNVQRVLRTESNRAYRMGTVLYSRDKEWAKGIRWNLSAAHPKFDICDALATEDSGLGPGVYPMGAVPDSGHPQCICYLTTEVQDDLLTAAKAAEKML